MINEVTHCDSLDLDTRRASRLQVVTLVDGLLQCRVGIVPQTEIVNLTADSLGPLAVRVRVEWKVRTRLGGLVGRTFLGKLRFRFAHDKEPLLCVRHVKIGEEAS